tara:strand:- start:17 stop:247 length:231 start_codon:yes stop_codon:yes gene_type:complete
MNVHVYKSAVVSVDFKTGEHEYSNGPYPIVSIKLGDLELTVFPADTAADLAAGLLQAGEELAAFAAELPKVTAIRE